MADSQAFPGSETVKSGPALGPTDGWRGEDIIAGSLSSGQELFRLHHRAAGPGQAFLVASFHEGADAAQVSPGRV